MSNVISLFSQDRDKVAYDFFERILPPFGLYCAAVKVGGDRFQQTFHESIESLWTAIREADQGGRETFMGTASYSAASRTIATTSELKCFRVDVDHGKGGHKAAGYETREEAWNAIRAFCEAAGLPTPMLVESGGGFHVYWALKKAIPRVTWQIYANGLKAACIEHGLHTDHSLTTNAAAILRPPGTSNYKLAQPRPVKFDPNWLEAGPYELDAFDGLLRFGSTPPKTNVVALLPPRPAYLPDRGASEAFPDIYELVAWPALVAGCGQYARFDTTGAVPEPIWMLLLNGMRYVVDGERLAHEKSSTDPRYRFAETQGKLDRAKKLTGPPLCASFKEQDGTTRAICLACPRLGLVRTPLQIADSDPQSAIGPLSIAGSTSQTATKSGSTPDLSEQNAKIELLQAPYGDWDYTPNKAIRPNSFKNTAIAIGRLSIACRHDTFHNIKMVSGNGIGPLLDDESARAVREQIITRYLFDPGRMHMLEALERECERNEFDPVREYLAGLRWDGVERLDRWLPTYVGAADTALNRMFGRKTLLAAVRRVHQPGCKFDQLLVLEGAQGAGKSSAWAILAGEGNFSDQQVTWTDPKQQREASGGVWIHEIAELVGLKKADVEHIKSFLSRQNDRQRPAYGRFVKDQPRQCIFVGTVNPAGPMAEYLTDPTGARRFWPVRCGRIDLAGLRQDRDQIWAEATHYEKAGESLELPPGFYASAEVEQDMRRIADPWFDILSTVAGVQVEGKARVSSIDLLTRDLGIERARVTAFDYARSGAMMRRLGWEGPKTLVIGGERVKGYERSV